MAVLRFTTARTLVACVRRERAGLTEESQGFGFEERFDLVPRIWTKQIRHGLGLGVVKKGEATKKVIGSTVTPRYFSLRA